MVVLMDIVLILYLDNTGFNTEFDSHRGASAEGVSDIFRQVIVGAIRDSVTWG